MSLDWHCILSPESSILYKRDFVITYFLPIFLKHEEYLLSSDASGHSWQDTWLIYPHPVLIIDAWSITSLDKYQCLILHVSSKKATSHNNMNAKGTNMKHLEQKYA